MQIDNVSSVKFQAYIPKSLDERMFHAAYKQGSEATNKYVSQRKNFNSWGMETSSLSLERTKTRDGIKESLSLVNSYTAPFKRVALNAKETILDTFMSLTKNDIINAEKKLNV